MCDPSDNRFFWLITYPRTGSNLLWRILSKDQQPGFLEGRTEYFFFPVTAYRSDSGVYAKNVDDWTDKERQAMKTSYQECFDSLSSSLAKAKAEGKRFFAKEHSSFMVQPPATSRLFFGDENVKEGAWQVNFEGVEEPKYSVESINELVIPESFLSLANPTFLIRHPALVFESQYRARISIEGKEQAKASMPIVPLEMTMRWPRKMYDWYLEYFAKAQPTNTMWPIVLDADDVMTNRDLVRHYATLIGMDSAKLQFTWEPFIPEAMSLREELISKLTVTINASTGVIESKAGLGLDLDTKAQEWKEEFGEEEGKKLEKLVREAMPDYEFMLSRKLKL
ncbi:hypothetical protein N431DRAFT_448566 [Stipitochalara longipes BDJ]|nr:hypothetical protein N431DRAFT_448566 [Stipitochalara longipes BDJ]